MNPAHSHTGQQIKHSTSANFPPQRAVLISNDFPRKGILD